MRKFFFTYMPASLLLLFLAMILWTCGGGGGGGGGGITTSTFTGSVSGTLVLAVDENGAVAAQDDTSGKTPIDNTSIPPRYPFTLTVPAGHQYTIYFVVTAEDRIVPLFSGTTNIFSVTAGGTIDLGYVDTTQAKATAGKDPLAAAGVTSGGATGDNTIKVEGYKWLILMDRSDVGKKYRTQPQLKNADGTVLTDGTLVKDVIVYDPSWKELPEEGSFITWNGSSMYVDTGSGPTLFPQSDIEVYLVASPGSLPDGFYTEVITDSNRNLHMVKMYFKQPTEVGKPTNLAQVVNPDNSITLSWTNPAGIAGPDYNVRLEIIHSDENGDGIKDLALLVNLNASANTYTIPASFVSSNLAGKQDLIWRVHVRQFTSLIAFPDGTSSTAHIYRNYSADEPLSLTPPTAIPFTTEMLAGKVFSSNETPPDVGIIQFAADGTGTDYHSFSDGMGGEVIETFTWNWSIDGNGRLIVDLPAPETDGVVTLLADEPTYLDVQFDNGIDPPENGRLTKVISFVAATLPGVYTIQAPGNGTITFVAGGTGSHTSIEGTENFTWSVDTEGVLILTLPVERDTIYLLAGSTATNLNIAGITFLNGTPHDVYAIPLIRQ